MPDWGYFPTCLALVCALVCLGSPDGATEEKTDVAHRLTGDMNSERGQNLIYIVVSNTGDGEGQWEGLGKDTFESRWREYCTIRGHKFRISMLKRLRGII